MSNLQFVFYDLTVILIIAHFLDSCKEQEWNEPMYFGSYVFWLVSTVLIITFTIIGIIPVYIGNNSGNIFSIIVWTCCCWIPYAFELSWKIRNLQ